ncbi:head-tail connector protein [Methylorubrum populi]|uniref:head-tail connector protein n=1 Tax=Methylorubrum populi TaxID=223967 RepID=UPI0031F92EEB
MYRNAFSSRQPAAPLVYVRVAPPAGDVVTLARARGHLRLDAADADPLETDLLEAAIAAAVGHLDGRGQGALGRALLTQRWQATGDRPADDAAGRVPGFVLELPPLRQVEKVERRVGGQYQELPAGTWEAVLLPAERVAVIPAGGASWPAADIHPAAWRITFTAGYGAGDEVPAPIRAAILLMVADLYDNRDGKTQANLVENPTVERLLNPFRAIGV